MGRIQWPLEVHGVQELLDDGVEVHEMTLRDLLILAITELRITNAHLSILSETEITKQDVGG